MPRRVCHLLLELKTWRNFRFVGIEGVRPIRQCPPPPRARITRRRGDEGERERERETNKARSIVETLARGDGERGGRKVYTDIRDERGVRLLHGATDPRFGRRDDEKLSACPNGTVARAILPSLASTDLKGRPQAPRRDARKRRSRSLSNRTPVCPLIAAQTFCFSSPFPPSPPFPPPENHSSLPSPPPSWRDEGCFDTALLPLLKVGEGRGPWKGRWNRGRSKSRGAFFAPIGDREGGVL